MFLVSEYQEIIYDLNENRVPKKWSLSKNGNSSYNTIDSWLNRIKYIFSEFNKWISEGYLNVYDLSIFSNETLFMTLLPIHFQKRLPEKKSKLISSDRIKLNFKLTKIEPQEEITEEKLKEIKRLNFGQDFLLIKGLKISGFKGHQENPKDIKSYRELNPDEINTLIKKGEKLYELLPIICVSYTVKEFQIDTKLRNRDEKSDDEDEEEEGSQDEKEEKIGGILNKVKNDVKMDKKIKKTEIKAVEENTKIDIKETKEVNVIQKTKIKYYKKHCKLEIPFEEEINENIYGINEPFGMIEIKFDCDKYRQEEYFVNKNIKLILDK